MSGSRDTTPKGARRSAGIATVSLCIMAVWFAYGGASAEITGIASDLMPRNARMVRRDISPAKFRHYANLTWATSAFFALAAGITFGFYRKLGEYT